MCVVCVCMYVVCGVCVMACVVCVWWRVWYVCVCMCIPAKKTTDDWNLSWGFPHSSAPHSRPPVQATIVLGFGYFHGQLSGPLPVIPTLPQFLPYPATKALINNVIQTIFFICLESSTGSPLYFRNFPPEGKISFYCYISLTNKPTQRETPSR